MVGNDLLHAVLFVMLHVHTILILNIHQCRSFAFERVTRVQSVYSANILRICIVNLKDNYHRSGSATLIFV